MSPTAELDYHESEKFVDWPVSKASDSFSNLSSAEDTVADLLTLWDAVHHEVISVPRPRPDRCRDDIRAIVQSARALAKLEDNWDGEGSRGYSLDTWRRVKRFVLTHASVSESRFFGASLPVPSINPADHGSLDVFWCLSDRQLLVNFPADEAAPITYYGQNSQGNNTISGRTTGPEQRLDLVAWLIQKTK